MAESQRVYGPAYSPMTWKTRERDAARAAEAAATAAAEAAAARSLQEGVRSASMALSLNVANAFANAGAGAAGMAVAAVAALGEAITSRSIPEAVMQRTNENICKAAQRSAFVGFTGRRPRRSPALRQMYASLRQSNSTTRASGALSRAIRSDQFYEATARRIRFINVDLLNKEAKHWKRLNFGAGAGAVRAPGKFQLEIGGQLIGASIGLDPDPRPGFGLPPGFFLGPGGARQVPGTPGSGIFIPIGKAPKSRTYGIVTTNFLDVGVQRLLKEMGIQYLELLDRYLQSLTDGEGLSGASVSVQIPSVFVRGRSADLSPKMMGQINSNVRHYMAYIRPRELISSKGARRPEPPHLVV